VSGRRDQPGWDELPLRDSETERAAENLPLFEADAQPASNRDAKSKRRGARRPDGAVSPAFSEPPLALDLGAAEPVREEPVWVQAAIESMPPLHADRDDALPFELGVEDGPLAAAGAARRPPLGERLLAGLADGVLHLAVLASALVAESLLGLQPQPRQWPGFVAFLVFFSFLYTTVPLAFWGQTPGMAWRGLRARDQGDRPLAFGQTALRWLGALVTVALVGLPALLALGGRSLADRLSRSETVTEAS
jgi:uncharacterized RDD family membrane protein YckC